MKEPGDKSQRQLPLSGDDGRASCEEDKRTADGGDNSTTNEELKPPTRPRRQSSGRIASSLFSNRAEKPTPAPPAPKPVTLVETRGPGSVITVAFDSPLYREFDYALPPELVGKVQPGQRVEAPFGKNNRPVVGFCIGLPTTWRMPKLKTILSVIDEQPLIDGPLMTLAKWIGEYYVAPIGRTLAVMVPSAVKRQIGLAHRTMVFLAVRPEQVSAEGENGFAKRQADATGGGDSSATVPKLRAKQQGCVTALIDGGAFSKETAIEIGELARRAGCTKSPIRQLVLHGVACEFEQDYLPGDMPAPARLTEPDFQLNDLQEGAITRLMPRLDTPSFAVTLLHGVTGSGKTEIYLRLIRRVLESGRAALVLIPEIALTTQAVDRYRQRLGLGSVAVIHSGLNDTQRHLVWMRIARGDYQVVLGTLSAVFAPCPRLGLIVVDEEQESSFKHLKAPRFHARDVAIKRAQILGIPAVLGSATPSLESWYNAQHRQRYEYIELARRVGDVPLPKVRVVDMHEESHARRGVHLLSRLLEEQVNLAAADHRQTVLLLNRRGYASFLFCQSCRFVMECERCKVRLTYHKSLDVGLCHQCGRRYRVPAICPSCGHKMIKFGLGTQRIEEELATKFPGLRVARVDSDTMGHARDYERMLTEFEAGRIDLLLGTQMIAKGLDFPNVRLVGVVSADTTLGIADFRASERTFQLVSQVAGRAGRAAAEGEANPGRVVVQTLHADLPAIQFAVKHDYRGFADSELASRQQLGYPPFGRLALFILRHRDRDKAESAGRDLAAQLEKIRAASGLVGRIIGPALAPISRIRGQFRIHVLVRAADAPTMQRWLAEARRQGKLDLPVEWVVDVDPLALM